MSIALTAVVYVGAGVIHRVELLSVYESSLLDSIIKQLGQMNYVVEQMLPVVRGFLAVMVACGSHQPNRSLSEYSASGMKTLA